MGKKTRKPPPPAPPVAPPEAEPPALQVFAFFSRHPVAVPLAALAALVLAMFGGVLLKGGAAVLGAPNTDMQGVFYAWRAYGFDELRKGNLALWNPYVFGGEPFFGGVQPGLLYPPNFIALFLSTAAAVNWVYAFHVWLLGATMFGWARERGLGAAAAFFSGAVLMFSGSNMPHIYAGHIPNVCTMAWAPAIFWAIDAWIARRGPRAVLWGVAAVAMHIMGGHPQYVFYTALGAGFYAFLRWGQDGWNLRTSAGLLCIYPGGAALVALQLAVAVQAAGESVRASHLPWDFVSMFGLPPENFLTLLAPNVFGTLNRYWGRCYLWEMSLFIGVAGALLAVLGAARGGRRQAWPLAATLALLWLLALGKHTPVFELLYRFAPGFDKFRGASKFSFPAAVMLAMLAGMGAQAVMNGARVPRGLLIGAAVTALALAGAGAWAATRGPEAWRAAPLAMAGTGEAYFQNAALTDATFLDVTRKQAAASLLIAAALTALCCGALAGGRRKAWLRPALLALGVADVFVFALGTRDTFTPDQAVPAVLKDYFDAHPGDYRVLNLFNANSQMLYRKGDLWGGDPNVGRRYGEFIAWTQGVNPDQATQNIGLRRLDPLYAMLRLKYVVQPDEKGGLHTGPSGTEPMPHALLVSEFKTMPGRDAIFTALREPGFDPRRTALLESAPNPAPAAGTGSPGTANVIEDTGDTLTVEAETSRPALLLLTDLYTPAWRAVALPGGAQQKYDVMPANYILRAVPLAAGKHKIRFEYAPPAFEIGLWISVVAFVAYFAAWLALWKRRPAA